MVFWVAAALLATITGWLVAIRAVGQARIAGEENRPDASADLYLRQIGEIDQLADSGLLDPGERQAARAEAGRRLLQTESEAPPGRKPAPGGLVIGLALTLTLSLGMYWGLGDPGRADEPYADRLRQWRTTDLATLEPEKLAALLAEVVKTRPDDARLHLYLGKLRLQAGAFFDAADSFRQATRLAPTEAEAHRLLGEALIQATPDGPAPPEAETAFARALQLDPSDVAARYFLADVAFRRGDVEAAISGWNATRAALSQEDPRRTFLDNRLAEASRIQAAGAVDESAIAGMVATLAERLRRDPDDPAGWARLVRSYGVMGRLDRQQQALETARRLFVGRPEDLARIEAEASRGAQAFPR